MKVCVWLLDWHQKWTSQKKQNDIPCVLATTTALLLVLSSSRLKFPVLILTKDHPPPTGWRELRQCGHQIRSKQDSLSHFKEFQMGIFGFWQKETGAKSVAMAVTQQVSFCFFCVVHFRCQVSRTLLQYTSRDISFQCFTVLWSHHFPNLHNTKYNRLYTERRYSKKCHSFLFWKAFQTGWNYLFTSWALQGQQVHIILAFKLPLAVL